MAGDFRLARDPPVHRKVPAVERVVYILVPEAAKLACRVRLTKLMKWEAFSDADHSHLETLFHARFTAYLRPEDRVILLSLIQLQKRPGEWPLLDGEAGRDVFNRMLDTGRLFFAHGRHVRLQRGAAEPVELAWDERSERRWQPKLTLRSGAEAFALNPPVAIDPQACTASELAHAAPTGLLAQWLASPPLDENAAAQFCLRLATRFPETRFPSPPCVRLDEAADARPVALLTIQERSLLSRADLRASWVDLRDRLRLRVRFRYGQGTVAWDADEATVAHRDGDRVVRIARDRDDERRLLEQLRTWGFVEDTELARSDFFNFDSANFRLSAPACWREVLGPVFASLDPARWQVEQAKGLIVQVAAESDFYGRAEAGDSGGDFSLEAGVTVGGRSFPILPALHQALRGMGRQRRLADVERWLREGDFALSVEAAPPAISDARVLSFVALPPAALLRLTEHVHELFDRRPFTADGRTRLGKWRVAELVTAGLCRPSAEARVNDLARLCERLDTGVEVHPRPAPAGLRAELRAYQQRGLGWLHTLGSVSAGGILADDMGLGKTVQLIAHLLELQAAGQLTRGALIVAPTSVIDTWETELARFAPTLDVGRYHGSDRDAVWQKVDHHDVTLTTYSLLWRDIDRLGAQPWDLAVLDEAQFIKNAAAKTAQAARSLQAERRLCLTGTPIENHLQDLWSLFEFILPGFLGDEATFREQTAPLGDNEGEAAFAEILRDRLRRRFAPFVLRRLKEDVLRDLPEKTEVVHAVAMTPVQADRYAAVREEARQAVRDAVRDQGLGGARMCILTQLLRLRQVCCDPRLVQNGAEVAPSAADSAKLTAFLELVAQLQAQGSRTLVFSQFTSMLELIAEALRAEGREHLILTGETKDRARLVERFQSGECPLFLISLRAGGFGLNLTAADSVIHYDPWWNPAVERQATDRSHRLGQTKPVFVYKLIVDDSIESKIRELQRTKLELARDLLSEGDIAHLTLDQSTIDYLLAE
jgi:hypothetical protein